MDSQTHGSKSSLRDVERQEVMPSEVTPLQSRTPSQHSIRSNRTIECPSGERGGGTNDVPIPMKTNGDDLCNNKLSPAVYDTEVTTAEVRLKLENEGATDPEAGEGTACTRYTEKVQSAVHGFFANNGQNIKKVFIVLGLIGYTVYVGFAVYTSPSGAKLILVLTGLAIIYIITKKCMTRFDTQLDAHVYKPISSVVHQWWWKYCRWAIFALIILGLVTFVVVDIGTDRHRLTSLGGMFFFVFITFITSTNPAKVKWRPVFWGLGLQVALATIILRWTAGYVFFRFLGDQVKMFLDFTDEGSKLVFGEEGYLMHRMAFKVFPIVIYFSAVISILYYWGIMQFIVCKIAWLMQLTMGTTAIESLNAACNIFIGMAESCVIMRPFLSRLTMSELHAVMTGGFATVAGSYIALLVEVGASPEHLLSAAIMSAPAALAMAKLSYPETGISQTRTPQDVYMEKTPARNLIEAASNGAIAAIKVVASVAANLIAILGLIAFLNALLSYVGARVGLPSLSFQLICAYLFWPVAAVMGVELSDASNVASLLGTKVFVDEFISFRDLGIMVKDRAINDRSTVIATYACCGFGSIAAVGVYIGALVSVSPKRRGDISEVALRAMWNGNVAGFLTACIAGVLYTGERSLFAAEEVLNSTLSSNFTAHAH